MRETVRQARRATVELATTAWLALVSPLFLGLLLFTAIALVFVAGAAVLPETVLLLRTTAGFKRRRVAGWTGSPVPEAYVPLTGGLLERVRKAVRDPGTYRDLRWLAVHFAYGLLLPYLALPLWVLGPAVDGVWCGLLRRPAVVLPLIARLAGLDARLSRALLLPSPEAGRAARLAERVEELTATRAEAIDAHGVELRRIERDLHDGTQAHLVALSMRVGLAKRAWETDPEAARGLLDDAQDQAEQALAGLRHVVRGIHPPVLTDRGLAGAVRALAASSTLQVSVGTEGIEDSGEPGAPASPASRADGAGGAGGEREGDPALPRVPAAVEAAAYFVVAEALTNAAKHSGASRAAVELSRTAGTLRISVRDEGRGGARESGGSGLLGLRRRVAALDGRAAVISPAGGPTVIEVELPCA